MKFYLGTHIPSWLWDGKVDVPLFVSRRRLQRQKTYKPAVVEWCLDSGGFSELNLFGRWETTPKEYVAMVRRYRQEIGKMNWAAPQDWMCEPQVLKKTGLTIQEHQRLTVENFLELRDLDSDISWIPVLQGWSLDDYHRCWEMYEKHGVHLEDAFTVGIGTVCRRQSTKEAEQIIASIQPLKIHGFGYKKTGLRNSWDHLHSADSMAWSRGASYQGIRLPGCTHKCCNNCHKYALIWRKEILGCHEERKPVQLSLLDYAQPR